MVFCPPYLNKQHIDSVLDKELQDYKGLITLQLQRAIRTRQSWHHHRPQASEPGL